MKKMIFFCICFFAICPFCLNTKTASATSTQKPMLAIVIDDFGGDRAGVERMLSIKAPLTCAIMPDLEFSVADAQKAHSCGHEVILHMPLESNSGIPRSWYGPRIISNNDTVENAKKTFSECLNSIPHVVGSNYHIGTGVSENKRLVTALLEVVKERNLYFLDSKTTQNSAGPESAKNVGSKFIDRDLFLEDRGPNYNYTKKVLNDAVLLAKEKGYAVVIGHVGPMGSDSTAKAIEDSLPFIRNEGVEIVPLSKIVQQKK